jgi:hypothetical protein
LGITDKTIINATWQLIPDFPRPESDGAIHPLEIKMSEELAKLADER